MGTKNSWVWILPVRSVPFVVVAFGKDIKIIRHNEIQPKYSYDQCSEKDRQEIEKSVEPVGQNALWVNPKTYAFYKCCTPAIKCTKSAELHRDRNLLAGVPHANQPARQRGNYKPVIQTVDAGRVAHMWRSDSRHCTAPPSAVSKF